MNNLIDELIDVLEAQAEYNSKRESYSGYDWGYHGFYERNLLDERKDRFEKALQKVIADEVKRQLGIKNE